MKTKCSYLVECTVCNKWRIVRYAMNWLIENGQQSRICQRCSIIQQPENSGRFRKGETAPTKGKKNTKVGGVNHYRWKGGITPVNEAIRKSLEYRLWREAVFRRDDYTCQECGERGVELHADHIKPFAFFPELRFAIDNGLTLCVLCHRMTSTWGGRVYGWLQAHNKPEVKEKKWAKKDKELVDEARRLTSEKN